MKHPIVTRHPFHANRWIYTYSARREAAFERGALYDAEEYAAIFATWAHIVVGEPEHTPEQLVFTTRSGHKVTITDQAISYPPNSPDDVLHAITIHARDHWGGTLWLPLSSEFSREERLRLRAYCDVYGLRLDDDQDSFLLLKHTAAELGRLPEMRRAIRAAHRDAPPLRPNEEAGIAAAYARRYPFRTMAA